jgi:hypothetical protein
MIGELQSSSSPDLRFNILRSLHRLFRPLTSDDASHDEALASRVAALNMLDLTLDHLGVEIDTEASGGLDAVVASCGKGLFF